MLCILISTFTLGLICCIVLPIIGLIFMLAFGIPLVIFSFIGFFGFFSLQPNEAAVVIFCGKYKGTAKRAGFHWCFPLNQLKRISLRSNNLNGAIIKVNDKSGNPIMIAAVVVWRVRETARAVFDVNDYFNYVHVQYESAVRHLAMNYAYEKTSEQEISLREGHEEIINFLMGEMHNRLTRAGIEVEEAKITTLSYAPEIASVMLKRQQAEAVVAARGKIVQGAISIIGQAISSLRENEIVEFNQSEKSRLISNLLVVLCSEQSVQPVLNTGS